MVNLGRIIRNVITPEMAHDVIESTKFMWLARIVDIASIAIVGFIFCLHAFTIITFNYKKASNGRSGRAITSMSEVLERWTTGLNTLTMLFIVSQFYFIIVVNT